MPRTMIAITDSPFPSLDPAKKALARLDPEYRMAKSPSADDILAVARDADAVLVTYAKLPGELLRAAEELQGDRPLRPRRRQYRPAGGEGARHRRQLRAGLLPARSVRPRHGAAAGARPQGDVCQQAGAIRPLGSAADRAAAPARRPGAGPRRLRQYSARAGAQGQGVRPEGPHLRSLCERRMRSPRPASKA